VHRLHPNPVLDNLLSLHPPAITLAPHYPELPCPSLPTRVVAAEQNLTQKFQVETRKSGHNNGGTWLILNQRRFTTRCPTHHVSVFAHSYPMSDPKSLQADLDAFDHLQESLLVFVNRFFGSIHLKEVIPSDLGLHHGGDHPVIFSLD